MMIIFKGHPQDGGLYTGYNVLQDNQVIGFISVCGIFEKKVDSISVTEEEKRTILQFCEKTYFMPSEWGCLGVGDSPTESFEDFLKRTNLRHGL